jgi:hypothetical protein
MFIGRGSRIKQLSIATVAAIALVAVAWPVAAKADAEEVFQVFVNSQSSMRTGVLCTAYANFSGGTGPYDFTWSGQLWWGSNQGWSSIRSDVFDFSGVFSQTLEAWDDDDEYDFDVRGGLVVGPNEDECFFVP